MTAELDELVDRLATVVTDPGDLLVLVESLGRFLANLGRSDLAAEVDEWERRYRNSLWETD